MMPDTLYASLSAIRDEYRKRMNTATDAAQRYASKEEMDKVSEFSTEAERAREAFNAVNRSIATVESFYKD